MKKFGVIGQGFVGGSLTTVMAERGATVYTYDKAGKRAEGAARLDAVRVSSEGIFEWDPVNSVRDFVQKCYSMKGFSGIYFVCVPTPMYSDGSADTSIVESVLKEIAGVDTGDSAKIAVVKSTVPPGSTQRWNEKFGPKGLHVVFNPEFLTEANALDDMRNQNRIILGGPRPHINRVKMLFQSAFPNVPIIKTSSTTAEMVKYMTNCHLAVKVSFANEMYQICESLDERGYNIDYDKVVEYAKFDKRLGESHWSVPGPVPSDDGRYVMGFGSHCFPKDLNALVHLAESVGVMPLVMKAAWEKNLEVRDPRDRDWERQLGRAVSLRLKDAEE